MLLVRFGEEKVVPFPPPPFYPGKDTGAFVSGERKKNNPQRIAAFMQILKKKKNGRLFFKKAKEDSPFSCKQAAFFLGSGPPSFSPSLLGRQKAFSVGWQGSGAGGGRGNAGSSARPLGCSLRCGAQA